ncbi:MAG: hypothetical protein JO250_11125 [Armatimonadetes bacterium]|nr:hypothetical protein [Armatimonadota bacterium]
MMLLGIAIGFILILSANIILPSISESQNPYLHDFVTTVRELGMGAIVAGTVGMVFEIGAFNNLFGGSLQRISENLREVELGTEKAGKEVVSITEKLNKEILGATGMLKNATEMGIDAVYKNRSDSDWERDVQEAIRSAKGQVQIVGTSLALVGGIPDGRFLSVKQTIQSKIADPQDLAQFQFLLPDLDGPGLRTRAKFEQPRTPYEETEAYKGVKQQGPHFRDLAKNNPRKVEVRFHVAPPACFMIITDERVFVEHYLYSGQGGRNIILSFKRSLDVGHLYQQHFWALWEDAEPAADAPAPDDPVQGAENPVRVAERHIAFRPKPEVDQEHQAAQVNRGNG